MLDTVLNALFDSLPINMVLRVSDGSTREKYARIADIAESVRQIDAAWDTVDAQALSGACEAIGNPLGACDDLDGDDTLFQDPVYMNYFRQLQAESDTCDGDDDLVGMISALNSAANSSTAEDSSVASTSRPLSLVGQRGRDAQALANATQTKEARPALERPWFS